ncbi:hypothetical protein IKG29_01945 [Candidatus Saccharibacteria bacterium]|nr:hypothetical protein [Candidatus Saccharibacteria bacterium]
MAVIHFKTNGGLVIFLTILSAAIASPLINTIGFGGYFITVVIVAILFYILTSTVNGGKSITKHKEYKKAIDDSTGVEKLRLKIRSHHIQKLKKNDKTNLSFPASYSITIAHINLVDTFYGMLEKNFKSTHHGELFDRMSDAVTSDKTKELTVLSRLFGIAFGIVIEKAADSTKTKINKKIIKSFVDTYMPNDTNKKEFLKMMTTYLGLKNSDTKTTWILLEKTTYALMDAKIKRDKDDIADPIVIIPLKTAIAHTNNNISLPKSDIESLKDADFIS